MENDNFNININSCCCCKGGAGNTPGGDTAGGTPIGHILAYMGTTSPENYLICDGTEYNITDYPELSEHFQTQFESINFFGGDGIDTFAVPDLRGEFLRGSGAAERNTGTGADVGVHQEATKVPNISCSTAGVVWTPNIKTPEGYVERQDHWIFSQQEEILKGKHALTDGHWDSEKNQPIGYNVRPTNTAVLYCIKYA